MTFTLDADTKERVRAATDIVELLSTFMELRRQGRNFCGPLPIPPRPSSQPASESGTPNLEMLGLRCWRRCFQLHHATRRRELPGSGPSFSRTRGYCAAGRRSIQETFRKFSRQAGTLPGHGLGQSPLSSVFAHQPRRSCRREYLIERGITEESIAKFELGMSPNSWSFLVDQVQTAGYTSKQLEAVALINRGERGNIYDFFRNRIMFPIRDTQNRVIAFGGRHLPGATEGGKYINSRESALFTKNQTLYGLDMARDTIRELRQAIVMEGYTDVIVAHQCGLTSSIAVLGTALGANHLKQLRHISDQVILLLDGDEAGQRRSDEVLELFLNAQMDVRVLTLPDGLDPADYLLKESAQSLLALANAAPMRLNSRCVGCVKASIRSKRRTEPTQLSNRC